MWPIGSGGGSHDRRDLWQPLGSTVGAGGVQDSSTGEAAESEVGGDIFPSSSSSSPSSSSFPRGADSESAILARSSTGRASSRRSPLPRYSSAESLSSFADSLVNPGGGVSSSSSSLVPAKSTPSLNQNAAQSHAFASKASTVNSTLHASRSTPNLEDPEDGNSMVTKKSSMYSYLHGTSSSSSKGGMGGSGVVGGRYWDVTMGADDTPDREDYAHHLRSSSYQLLHTRQLSALSSGSAGSYHSRQHSNTSNYSESDDLSPRADLGPGHTHHSHHHGMDRARFFSYDNLGPESASHKYHGSWNMSEPDLTLAPPPYSPPGPGFQQHPSPITSIPSSSAPPPPQPSVRHSPTSSTSLSTGRHPSSPPPPPVRDASSLKYIKYGPGHEKYPSWPVPAANANQVIPPGPSAHDANVSGLPESSLSAAPQGSHRSKSWTEQSEYPKEKSGGYARPYNKKPFNQSFQRQLKTVMERTEKLPKEALHNSLREDMFSSSNYSYMDSYYKSSSAYYPLYDRDGRPLDDKDYSIPSPPERDLGPMGEATLSQVTAAQFEEYARRYEEYGYADLIGTTPLLDQLRRESVTWDGSSERDSGRGESESVADSARYSNGRESVTTVVTNSSSASSSETLKWHGSLSDISIMSGHSRDPRSDHNIVHSSRVQAPQRHNSESVLYYGVDGRGKPPHGRLGHDSRELRRSIRDTESGYPRPSREGKWSREVERNNEMNNLKKFPSYSYTQPLSQITEAPTAEMRETPRSTTRSPQSPTIDISKPPSVAERIHELERQSRTTAPEGSSSRWPRDHSGSRERTESRDSRRVREDSSSKDARELCDVVESLPSKDQRDPREHRESREHRDPSETRGHQRRGSRDSQRDLRLDFSRTEQKCEGSSHSTNDTLRSPSTLGPTSTRSPTQKDPDGRTFGHENFQNLINAFTEVDRNDRGERVLERPERTSSNVSYSYLDPEKKCKVSDATLKSIQKQAVMSFYERHAGKSSGGASLSDLSSASSQSSLVSSPPPSEGPQGKWGGSSHASMMQAVRTDRSGRAGKGLARLGRVPEGESDDHSLRPPRRRSMSGRDSGSEGAADDLSRGGSSQRSSLASETASSSRSEQPPALPEKQSQHHLQEALTRTSVTSSQPSIPTSEEAIRAEEAEPVKDDESSSRAPASRGLLDGILATSDLPSFPPLQSEPPKPPSLPPPAQDEPPPRPPERPPKKPTLRSLFHGPTPDSSGALHGASPSSASAHANERGPTDLEMRRIEESANDLRNLSPARPYYYRKPPAPDPPRSPEATPAPAAPSSAGAPGSPRSPRSPRAGPRLHTSPTHAAHLVAPTSAASRSSTPDLPPPPPPPVTEGEVVHNDDPLPPPPTPSEVASPPSEVPPVPPDSPPRERLTATPPPVPREKAIATPQTYHKDSYMAHRRDWKTGFEGRYRRTISPSAANRNLLYSREDNANNNHAANNKNNNDNANNNINASSSPTNTAASSSATNRTSPSPSLEHERRSPATPPAGVLRPVTSSSSLVLSNNSKNVIDNDNVNNNGWPNHARPTSTTVSFTAEELRAFKARRAHAHNQEGVAHSSDNKENAPRPLHPSQSSPSLSSTALRSLASDGSTTSLTSAGAGSSLASGRSASPASPTKLSPAHSWRTSLDSLHRPPLSSPSPLPSSNPTTTTTDTRSSSPRLITRATSLADPLNKEEAAAAAMAQEAPHLPSTSSVSESLNRIAAISDSLSRSTSVTESLCRSLSLTESPGPTHSRSSSVTEAPTCLSSPLAAHGSSTPTSPSSPTSPVPHDGPVTAHPATVTEEPSPTPIPTTTPKAPSSPKSPLSSKSLSPKPSLTTTPLSPTSPLPPATSKVPTFTSSSPSAIVSATVTATCSTHSSSSTSTTSSSSSSTTSSSSTVPTVTPSFPMTSPSMSPTSSSVDKSNIVVLSYGRTRNQEEIECEQLSKDYVPHLLLDSKLRSLLAPGPEHKTAAYYMQGVFTLELRKDLINSTHAHHPDLSNIHAPKNMAPNNTHTHTSPTSTPTANGDATPCMTSDKSPLPADSAYFTTSESKAKLLTRLRGSGSNLQDTITPVTDHHQLMKKKEELVASIGRKLEILKAEREAIKEEMRLNHELGAGITQEVEVRASVAEAEKYKLHVEEIDKITSLLLGLSGRLARAENALLMLVKDADPEEKRILEGKRDKLRDQLEEAKRLKENTDRRAIQIAKVLNQYLNEDEYADYDHFIKMKAKLIMDAREIDDKIKLGEEQQQALRETMCCKNP